MVNDIDMLFKEEPPMPQPPVHLTMTVLMALIAIVPTLWTSRQPRCGHTNGPLCTWTGAPISGRELFDVLDK
ncbi:hypothetical protein GWI33_021355 [Rhynchophorus ferrugineus]|uniref:Uncharacterized protein n=1 Tax=Rhynchophorus ferrugineus TaxID=354439 RepID=A0A834M3A9_RHYFE|nr:hypothetical protein GWI33_021355 [Rhynchophorus ferrugineus]